MKSFKFSQIKQRTLNSLAGRLYTAVSFNFIYNLLMSVSFGVAEKLISLLSMAMLVLFGSEMTHYALTTMTEEKLAEMYSGMDTAFMLETYKAISVAELLTIAVGAVILFLYSTFVQEHISAGLSNGYLRLREGSIGAGNLTTGFTRNYLNVAKVAALKCLYMGIAWILPAAAMYAYIACAYMIDEKWYIWLSVASYLLMIPAIILYYQYIMVPYILADNPHISPKKVFAVSRKIMKGSKFKMFLLQLPFIVLLLVGGMFAATILAIFSALPGASLVLSILFYVASAVVMAYYTMAKTEVYCELKYQAAAYGEIDPDDVAGIQIF